MENGLVISSSSGLYNVLFDKEILQLKARGIVKQSNEILAGDRVEFDPDFAVIEKIQTRKNSLIRPKIANLDLVVLVTSIVQPNLNLGLLDRQLITLTEQKIETILYFSKIDLASPEEIVFLNQIKEGYRKIGYQIVEIEDEITNYFGEDKIGVVMGQTGVGKSSLINKIITDADQKTNEISQALSRGKHTTRQTELIKFGNGWLADSPGFSSFEVFNMKAKDLQNYFPEFVKYRSDCRFADCQHINEVDCKIKEEVGANIMSSRYRNYCDFYQLIKEKSL